MHMAGYSMRLIALAIVVSTIVVGSVRAQVVRPSATVQRDAKSGESRLVAVNVPWITIRLRVTELWRYDVETHRWTREPFKVIDKTGSMLEADLTDKVGLYWVKWTENDVAFANMVFSGSTLCNDIALDPLVKGDMIATCIPVTERMAKADYVPDPKIFCKN